MITPVFFTQNQKALLASLVVFAFGVVYFLYAFWQYLISMTAVSYLAKDIMENKEVKSSYDYFSYVKENGGSYRNYWLWTCLFYILIGICIVFAGLLCYKYVSLPAALSVFCVLLVFLLLWPLSLGLGISYYFWAYGDKKDVLARIKEAVNLCYKKPFEVIGFFIISGFSVFVLTLPIFFILGIIILFVTTPIINSVISDPTAAKAAAGFVSRILQYFVYYISTLYVSFIATKFYFNFIKNDNE